MTYKPPIKITSGELAREFIDKYDNFLFDCDGVIWLDEKLIPGVNKTIEYLQLKNKKFAFVTNNSSKSRDSYIDKFQRLGFKGVSKDIIFPTCYAAAATLKHRHQVPEGSKIWVCGDTGIEHELKDSGYVPLGGSDARLNDAFAPEHDLLKVDPEVKAVVVGSTKEFNYMRIATTLQYLIHDNKSIPFIGTNIDRTYPGPEGLILPAGGSVVHYMKYTANRDFIDVGKPSTVFLETVLDQCGFEKHNTLMVGDTLYTDIKFGNDGGLGGEHGGTLLVLSGGTKQHDLDAVLSNPDDHEGGHSLIPLYYIESLGHLFELLNKTN